MRVKVIYQAFTTPSAIGESWALILDGKPSFIFYNKEQLEWFLRGLNGKY
jgi:hypothetical protein